MRQAETLLKIKIHYYVVLNIKRESNNLKPCSQVLLLSAFSEEKVEARMVKLFNLVYNKLHR